MNRFSFSNCNFISVFMYLGVFTGLAGCGMVPGLPKSPKGLDTDESVPAPIKPGQSAASGGGSAHFDWPRINSEGRLLSSLTPWERGLFLAEQLHFGTSPVSLGAWWLDLTPGVSQTERLAFVAACLRAGKPEASPAVWALCADDTRALDRKAFAAELTKLDATTKSAVLAHFDWVLAGSKEALATLDLLAASDKGVAQLIAATQTAKTEWNAASLANGTMVRDSIAVMDAWRANPEKNRETCTKILWPHVAALVKKYQATAPQIDVFEEFASEPVGNLLSVAMSGCFYSDASRAEKMGPRAGIRTSMLQAVWRQQSEQTAGKTIQALEWEHWPKPAPWTSRRAKRDRGVIANVEPQKRGVLVTFKAVKVKFQECAKTRETDKIEAISDGKLVYRTVCTEWRWATANSAAEPALIPSDFAAGLKPGLFLELTRYEDDHNVPTALHQGPDASSPVVVRNGVAL